MNDALCQAIADMTKRFCRVEINPLFTSLIQSCWLIPLNKNPGIHPLGIGEIRRRIMAKAVTKISRSDIQAAGGTLPNLHVGIDRGIEAAIHAMAQAFDNDTTEGFQLVHAENAFNYLNRKTALTNIKSICPPFATFLNNLYQNAVTLHIPNSDQTISSEEGTTQGCPAAFYMYALAIVPSIKLLSGKCINSTVKQAWFADDSSAVEDLRGILNEGFEGSSNGHHDH